MCSTREGRAPAYGTNGDVNWGRETGTPATANLNVNLATYVQRLSLDRHGVEATDLLPLWTKGCFLTAQDLLDSVEHIAAQLEGGSANEVTDPKAWVIATLSMGYYPAPEGFKSWTVRQEEARLRDAQKRLEQLREARRQRFEVELEIWLTSLSPDRKRELLAGTAAAGNPQSPLAKSLLRQAFIAESGLEPDDGAVLSP